MTADLCVLDHRDTAPRRAEDGLRVCVPCLRRTEQALEQLPHLYGELELQILPAGQSSAPRVSGTPDKAPAPNGRVVDHRRQIPAVLASWVQLVAEERVILPPRSPVNVVDGAWVTELCRWLLVHLRWCLAQPWAGEIAPEILKLRSDAWSLAYPSHRRRFVAAPCPERSWCDVATASEQPCPGSLWALLADSDSLLPAELVCDWCYTEWSSADWLRLARKVLAAS